MPIASPIGYLDVVNATLRASQVEAVSRLSVANTATTQSFSVGDKFHVNKDSVDPVSITGNVVASGVKIGNLSISPAFDFASVSNVGNVTANVIQFANATTGFTTTANVEIGGNIGLTANAQVKIGSNVLAEYTGPHGREPKEVPLKKYPEIAFEEGKFDKNDVGNTFIQAGYTITGSGTDSVSLDYPVWLGFNGKTVGLGDAWHSENDYNSTTGAYSGTKTTSETSNTWSGDYIELKIPKPVKMSHLVMFVQPMSGTANSWESRFPKEFVVLGSQDGTTWSFIKSVVEADGFIPPAQQDVGSYLQLDANAYYKYFRIVVSKNRGNTYATIGELEYYGYEEPAPPGDLSLDTTIKSTFNSVRSNNYVMYFDGDGFIPGDDTSNNLVTGSSVSVVHHNATYDSTGKYWTLDGSTGSNVTTGDLGFEGDVPHTVSMWVNASNVEDKQLFTIGSGYDKSFLKVDDTQIAANTWHNVTYAYQGEGGSKVTYVDGRKVEEAQAEDTTGAYPPFAMTDYEVGGFRVSASSEYTHINNAYPAWEAFDETNPDDGNGWLSQNTSDYNSTTGLYEGAIRLSPTTELGEWIKLELPYRIYMNFMEVSGNNAGNVNAQSYKVYGSNDDENWYEVLSRTDRPIPSYIVTSELKRIAADDISKAYKYFAFVVTKTKPTQPWYTQICEMKYFGHKEGDLTRFPEPTRVLKYPHIPMTGPGQRGYVASASSTHKPNGIPRLAHQAFNGVTNDDGWGSFDGGYFNTTGLIDGAPTHPEVSEAGEWIQIQLPHKLLLDNFTLSVGTQAGSDRDQARYPKEFKLYGYDGSSWAQIGNDYSTAKQTSGGQVTTYDVTTTTYYSKFLIIIKKTWSITGEFTNLSTFTQIGEWQLFGTQEDTGTPAIMGGPFAGKVANFRVYDQYLGDERIQEIYDAQKDAFGHKKSSMTFYKGRIGVGTTEPEGALTVLDEPHALAKFPARAVSADDSYVEGDGEIKLSAADGSGYRAFDGLTSTSWDASPERHTRLSEEVDFGAWLKIQTPESISLKKAEIESNPYWRQVGPEIAGDSTSDQFGVTVACNHDGTRIMAAAPKVNSYAGRVRVYDWTGSTWVQVGQNLTGANQTDARFGHALAMSGDGNIIAIGAPFEHTASLADAGVVRVYYLNGGQWTVLPDSSSLTGDVTSGLPDTFIGSATNDQLGQAVKLSYDGRTLAFNITNEDEGGTDRGQVRILTYTNGAWSNKGSAINGTTNSQQLGLAIDMSDDGDHIIIGANDGYPNPPEIRVFKWNGSDWELKGSTFTHTTSTDGFGQAVAISNDGNVIAIGIRNADFTDGAREDNTGIVRMYHWSNSAWTLKDTLRYPHHSTYDDDDFGTTVNLSGDGKRLIVSAPWYDNSGDDNPGTAGRLFVYEYDDKNWFLRRPSPGTSAPTTDGYQSAAGTESGGIGLVGNYDSVLGAGIENDRWTDLGLPDMGGQSIAISRDGSAIVAGEWAYNSSSAGGDRGRVRVWNMPSNIKSIWGSNDNENWTKITTAPTREEATSNVAGVAFGYDDRLEFKNLDNPNYYKYHAIVADAFTRLKDVKLFGVRKQGSSTLHDGALTLTKNLDVPRIGPPPDADDTPRRDRLVVEYNTSTNPVEDGLVKDTSGRGNDGAFYGGASYNATEKALVFDGADDYVTFNTNLSGNAIFSISLWFKSVSGGIETLVQIGNYNPNEVIWVYKNDDTLALDFVNNIYYVYIPDDRGVWHHLVCTYDGNSTSGRRIFMDNIELTGITGGTLFGTNPNLTNHAPAQLGSLNHPSGQIHELNGSISNFKLYDTALTAEEVKTLYDMGRCDEGGHIVNFSKTRVGIGLGDGEAPQATLDVRGRIMREYNPGEIIEELNTVCNGRPVTVLSGTYTPTNVTAFQTSSLTHTEINGSNITYNKPAGAKRIYYKFACQWDDNSLGAITNFKIRVYHNGAWRDINPSRYTHAAQYVNDGNNHGSAWVINEYIFECDADTESQHDGRFLSSKTSYTFDVTWRHHGGGDGSNYNSILHMNQWWDGTGTDILHPPQLTIRAIA